MDPIIPTAPDGKEVLSIPSRLNLPISIFEGIEEYSSLPVLLKLEATRRYIGEIDGADTNVLRVNQQKLQLLIRLTCSVQKGMIKYRCGVREHKDTESPTA